MKKIAVYAGSFDPITIGHSDVISRASKLFDEVVVAIGLNTNKKPMFELQERLGMVESAIKDLNASNVKITQFNGLLVKHCKEVGASFIIRGLRAVTDFEYELQIAHANRVLDSNVETIWLPTKAQYSYYSSSIVKELLNHNADISSYVLPGVLSLIKSIRKS